MIKMLQYKMYPAGELAVLRQLLLVHVFTDRIERRDIPLQAQYLMPFDEFSSHVVLHFYRQSQKRRVYFQIYSIMMAWESTEVRFDLTDIGQQGSD